jgi:hypothetical protein
MLAWPAMETAPEPAAEAPVVGLYAAAGLVGAATALALFAGDGSDVDGVLPVGGVAVALLAAAAVLFAFGRLELPRPSRAGWILVGSTLGLAAWTGVTVLWSIVPDRSWEAFNKSVAFAAFLGLGLVLAGAARGLAARAAAFALAAVTGAVLGWALLAKAVPALDPGGDRVARLREPVDYWNALALIADIALGFALWLGASRTHRVSLRVAGGVLAYGATLALLLTLSRTGVAAAAIVVVLWLVVSRERVEGGLLLAAAVIPAALVAGWAFTRPALVEDGAERADRVADGALLAVLALVGGGIVAVAVVFGLKRELDERTRWAAGRGLLGGVVLGVVAAIAAFVVAVGNPVTWVGDRVTTSCDEVINDPSRLTSFDLNNRLCWWREAWEIFVAKAPGGAGAGSFQVARKRYRNDARNVVEPHSVPLQQLADGGIVGLGLFLALMGSAGAVCICALRRLEGDERAAAVALVLAPAAYAIHALVDYDWDFLAATAPALLALGALVGAGRPRLVPFSRPLVVAASVLVAAVVLVSFSFPRLAERSVRGSTRALEDRRWETARDRALWGRFFNPLSVAPIEALGRIAQRQRRYKKAEKRYVQAVELQPENPETWYALGYYEFAVLGNQCAAYRFLNNAYTLDPSGNQWTKGGILDQSREAVNGGACVPS